MNTQLHPPGALTFVIRHSSFVICSLLLLAPLQAQTVPLFINYQGKVTDSAGVGLGTPTPLNRKVIFRIYDAATSGTLLWTEEQTVTLSGGEFSVLLGQGIAFQSEARPALDTVFTSSGTGRYLQITVDNGDGTINGSDAAITPRQQITSTAYSFRARSADTVASGSDLTLNNSANYGLGWYGTGRTFGGVAIDGPVLYGNAGGALGSYNGTTQTTALRWNNNAQVGIGSATLSGMDLTSKLLLQGDDGTAPPKQLTIRGNADNNKRLYLGYNTTGNYGALQAYNGVSTTTNLRLNEAGGNVGIGATSPTSPLFVTAGSNTAPNANGLMVANPTNAADNHAIIAARTSGAGGNPMLAFDISGVAGYTFGIDNADLDKLKISRDWGGFANTMMTFTTAGDVSIGATAPADKFQVTGGNIRVQSSGAPVAYNLADSGGTNRGVIGLPTAGGNYSADAAANDIVLRADTGKLLLQSGTGASAICVASGNNVGIGTASTDGNYPLTLRGKNIGGGDSGLIMLRNFSDAAEWHLSVRSSGALDFSESGQADARLFLAAGGNVGIGTNSPGDRLHVKGGMRVESGSSTTNYQIYVDTFNSLLFKCNLNGGNYAYLNSNTSGLISTSDRRVKKDIEPMKECLPRLMKLTPSTFRYKHADAGTPLNYGFIAQDVETQFPDIVLEKDGLKHLASAAFEGINARAIQELKKEKDAEVKALQDENADLKTRLAALEARDKARDTKLAAIEKLLSRDAPAARTVSLKKAGNGAE